MTAKSRAIILILALVGLGFAGASSWVHYKLLTDPTYQSICDLNSSFNCTQAYLSEYGSVAGVPVALGGLAWFGIVALIAGFARPNDKTSAAGGYIFVLSTIALAAVLYLAWASWFQLEVACILCIGTYVSVLGIFIVSGAASSVGIGSLPARLPRDLRGAFRNPMALVASLTFIVAVSAAITTFPKESTRDQVAAAETISGSQATDFEKAWFAQPRLDLGIPANGASVVVVKFNVQTRKHPAACEASAAVRIAREMNRAEEMEDWIYAQNLQTLTAEQVKAGAEKLLGITNFDAQYQQRLADIRRDVADGGVLQIRGTPTMFINGVRVDQVMPPAYFEMAINLELKKASK